MRAGSLLEYAAMQAVILAAGRGTRMGALTETVPKPMLRVSGKTLLEHKFDALTEDIDEVIIIVGYLGNVIKDHFGEEYHGKRLRYIVQENIVGGTADALWQARTFLHGRFLVMMGDDIYAQEDVERSLKVHTDAWTILVQEVSEASSGGFVTLNTGGRIIGIAEGAHAGSGLMNTNMCTMDTRVFDFPMVPKAEGSNEFGLPQTVLVAAHTLNIPVYPIQTNFWLQISAPEDLKRAEEFLRPRTS